MNKIEPLEWIPVDGFNLEIEALDTVKSKTNTLVVAGPGAGKTELLAQRACYLLQTHECVYPKKILAISFKRDAAANLRDRVELRCGKELANRFESKTYDAFAKEILDRFLASLEDKYQPRRDYGITEAGDLRRAFEVSGYQYNKKYADLIGKISLPFNETDTAQMYHDVWNTLLKGKSSDEFIPKLTFEIISRLSEFLIRTNEYIKKSIQMTYSHVFLDEFQDTTSIQYDLVKTCFLTSDSVLTAVGDSKQRIMLWAGARPSVFTDYMNEFNATRKDLIMNHRSAPRLVEIQKALYQSLNEDGSTITPSQKWNPEDGLAYLRLFSDPDQEAEKICDEIKEITCNGVLLKEICILVKQEVNVYSTKIVEELKALGIKARNEALYQDLLKEDIIKILLALFKSAVYEQSPEEWIYLSEVIGRIQGIDVDADAQKIRDFVTYLSNLTDELSHQLDVNSKESFFILVDKLVERISKPRIVSLFPQYANMGYLDKLVNDFSELLWLEYEETSNWGQSIENLEGENSIAIMTIHKSKGLEFDTIFFVGLEDSAFWNFRNQPGEDRCAFFVALSRAKRRIDFTFCAGRKTRFNDFQKHQVIDEFYHIFDESGIVEQIDYMN